ncbi:MAG TPA: TIGR01777 family oxidoreductase [Candidatus Binatia bacterium]|nr:TIGR01777 family oxidoreductase [Candidatus Binatia bacterium]
MRVVVTGATGLIGRALCRALAGAGHAPAGVGRRPALVPAPTVTWDRLGEALRDAQAVVNLAGEPIAARRWTRAQKARIRDSRVLATRALVEGMAAASPRPTVLVSASAVGWYGPRGDEPLDETAAPGEGFLAEVCRAWEGEALRAEALGVRVVLLRIGVVLAPDGGALARMLIPFRAGLGGPLGNGRQWVSWVHRDDVVGLVLAALATDVWRGPVNATAPAPVTNRDFARALGRVLGRPAVLPAPALALRLALGEMASMLLTGQRVLPKVAEERGYAFRHPGLAAALEACIA